MSRKSDFDLITQGFIQYLEKTGQLAKLPHLAKEQVHLSRTLFDPNLAIVSTVVMLDSSQIVALETKLKRLFNRPIKVKNLLDPQILGGLLIRIGDEIIDLSLKYSLASIRDHLYA